MKKRRTKQYAVVFAFTFLLAMLLMPKDVIAAAGTLKWGSYDYNEATGTLTITGSGAIDDETGALKKLGAKHVVIQKGVTEIGNYTFKNWDSLESVSLPDGLKKMGYHAFRGCEKLTGITIPATVTETASNIGGYCFLKSGLQTVTFADGMTIIPVSICAGAEKLTTVNMPKTVREIRDYAFSDCIALENITIYDKVTTIGKYDVFKNCGKLAIRGYTGSYAEQYAKANKIKFQSIGYVPPKKGEKAVKSDITYKITKADTDGKGTATVYRLNKNRKSVTIPGTITVKGYTYQITGIAAKAFYRKNKVQKISLRSTAIKSIGRNAFKGINKKAVFKVPKSRYKQYKKMLTAKTGFAKKTMKVKK
ncbi:MAG: leucine-rich repeat domain-containing protein [Bacteroidales bacterium]|nr:leucine-rich repeat domain-containing protein [Clostridium sp.]MCM1204552.1 leucine-rich repeat domain-containing protein [Bacteroidales bacterium]